MDLTFTEIFGYCASIIIAISMTMSSIVKFRWINLVGASSFLAYGILFSAWPVVVLNTFIVSVDIFYLRKIYNKTELFDTLQIKNENNYLVEFLKYHKAAIDATLPNFVYRPELNTVSFFVLRNMAVAGIFLGRVDKDDSTILHIGLDFVVPEYRDYKSGKYIYEGLKGWFIKAGFEKLRANTNDLKQTKYLKKMGFYEVSDGILEKQIYTIKMQS